MEPCRYSLEILQVSHLLYMSIGTKVIYKKSISTFKSYPLNYISLQKTANGNPVASTLKPNCISQDTAVLALPPSLVFCVLSALITALPTPPSALTLANPILLDLIVCAVPPNDIEIPAIVIAAPPGVSVWPSIMKPFISSPEASVGNAEAVPSTTMPEEARMITLSNSVMGEPPMERVVPSIAIVLGAREV